MENVFTLHALIHLENAITKLPKSTKLVYMHKLLLNYWDKFQPNKFCSHHDYRITARYNENVIILIQIPMANVDTPAFL